MSVAPATSRQPSMNLHTANASEQTHGVDAQAGDARLRFAITNRRLIQFRYDGNLRLAEPHDYGTIGGEKQLLIYQISGESRSVKIPDWRLVRVAAMKRARVLDKEFAGGRTIPSGNHKKWDQLIARVKGRAV